MIREAQIDDLPRLVPMAKVFFESLPSIAGLDPGRFVAAWTRLLQGPGILLVCEVDGEIIGGIGAVVHEEIYSGERIMSEMFWYVSPQHRGHGLKLYRELEKAAKAIGCTQIRMVHLLDSSAETLRLLYHRMGYQPLEQHYWKGLS